MVGTGWDIFGNVLATSWNIVGHVLEIFWKCFGNVLDMFWARFGHVFGHVLDMLLAMFLGMFCACFYTHGVPPRTRLLSTFFRGSLIEQPSVPSKRAPDMPLGRSAPNFKADMISALPD